MEIKETIKNIINELDSVNITRQRRRYLVGYLSELETYHKNNPYETNTPNSFELYCSLNPQAPECLKYDV